MINTIIFDMDGVIIDSVKVHFRIWKEVAAKYNVEFDEKFLDRVNGMDTPRIAQTLVDEFKLSASADEIAVEKRRLSGEKIKEGVELFPGVKDTLGNLKKLGYRIGLATMSPREHVENALGTNILNLELDKIVTADDVANPKPAPDIFLKCAEKLGKEPEQCVVVEDAINGITAAKSAGMKAIALTTTTSKDKFTEADAIIPSIKNLNSDLIHALESKIEITKEEQNE
ncbi:MAG: HAD family hydrolase [Nanoarchaeota archaeon]